MFFILVTMIGAWVFKKSYKDVKICVDMLMVRYFDEILNVTNLEKS